MTDPIHVNPTILYPPSSEAKHYYYGIPSRPLLVARSSTNVWLEPTGPEAYLIPKELSPMGSHPLREIWETKVGPAMVVYLDFKGVKCTSLDPVRMGNAGESSSSPVIIWMGVVPGSLSAEDGIAVATHCRGILSAHGIDDVHVEIRESEVTRSAGPKLYKPVPTSNATARAREPFSTALSLPICSELTPTIEGTGGFFISDPRYHAKIYLVTARHVVFPPDSNEFYQHGDSSHPRKNVLLFGDAGIEKYVTAIRTEIGDKHIMLEQLDRRLRNAEQIDDEEDAKAERNQVLRESEQAKKAIEALEKFLLDVSRHWKKREDRVLGHVVLSPPISLAVGEEGFTEDWAVINIDDSKINSTNFVGNVIDLGTTISVEELTAWMSPQPISPPSFQYPGNRLLKFDGIIPDDEIWKPSLKNTDQCIMVMKRGHASDLTVGRLNNARSFTRVYSNDQPGPMSKEIAVLPRNSNSGAFAEPGDSGSAVVDGKGRLAGLLTSGAGDKEVSDCIYLTSINFILNRMLEHGIKANLSPYLIASTT